MLILFCLIFFLNVEIKVSQNKWFWPHQKKRVLDKINILFKKIISCTLKSANAAQQLGEITCCRGPTTQTFVFRSAQAAL